jgi:hypothetical protein
MHNYFGTKRESIKLDQLGSPAAGGVSRMWDLFFFEKSCQAHLVLIFISGGAESDFFLCLLHQGRQDQAGEACTWAWKDHIKKPDQTEC